MALGWSPQAMWANFMQFIDADGMPSAVSVEGLAADHEPGGHAAVGIRQSSSRSPDDEETESPAPRSCGPAHGQCRPEGSGECCAAIGR